MFQSINYMYEYKVIDSEHVLLYSLPL